MNKVSLAVLVVVAILFGVTGCNTMAGAGQDIKAGGQSIENAADASSK